MRYYDWWFCLHSRGSQGEVVPLKDSGTTEKGRIIPLVIFHVSSLIGPVKGFSLHLILPAETYIDVFCAGETVNWSLFLTGDEDGSGGDSRERFAWFPLQL